MLITETQNKLSRKHRNAEIVFFICSVLLAVLISKHRASVQLTLEMSSTVSSSAQLFYDVGRGFTERDSTVAEVFATGLNRFQKVVFDLPARNIGSFRFDPAISAGTFVIKNVAIRHSNDFLFQIPPANLLPLNQIATRTQRDKEVLFTSTPGANDPEILFRTNGTVRLKPISLRQKFALFAVGIVALCLIELLVLSRWEQTFTVAKALSPQARCIAVLFLLPVLAYVPASWNSVSLNPSLFESALVLSTRGGVLHGYPWTDPNTGFTTQALGSLSARTWLQGTVPWWNPDVGVGLPLAAEMQPASLFLPFVLLLNFANGVVVLKITLQIAAGLATYLLLRHMRLGHLPALAGAAIYQFNGTFAWLSHAPIMPVPFLPLLLLGIERAATASHSSRRRGWALIAIAIAYSAYAGFPETAFLDGLLALVWALQRIVVTPGSARLAFARKVSLGGVVGVLLSAPIIVPFLEYLRLSGLGRNFASISLPKISFAACLFPYLFGPIHGYGDFAPQLNQHWGGTGGYFGYTTLFFAALAMFGKSNRGLRVVLALWIATMLALSFSTPGISTLFHLIPGVNVIAVYRYSDPSWELAGAILVAFAFDDWQRAEHSRLRPTLFSLASTLLFGGVALWLAWGLISHLANNVHRYPIWPRVSLIWAIAMVIAAAAICARRAKPVFAVSLTTLLLIEAMALYAVPTLSGFRNTLIDLKPVTFLQQHLGLQRFYTLGPLRPNYAAYFQIASINHNAAPLSADWIRYVRSFLDPDIDVALFVGNYPPPFSNREQALRTHLAAFEFTGVKYVLTSAHDEPFGPDAPGQTNNSTPQPRLVFRDQLASIFELPRPAPYFEAIKGGPCQLTAESRQALVALCRNPALLLRRELFYPGWRARVNGQEVVPARSASIFQAVNLPEGHSYIRFDYCPSQIGWAYVAAALGLTTLFASRISRLPSKLEWFVP